MATSRISELASLIAVHTAAVDAYLSSSNLPEPSFSPEFPAQILSEAKITASRQIILEATDELHSLLLGPIGALTSPSVRIPTSYTPLPNPINLTFNSEKAQLSDQSPSYLSIFPCKKFPSWQARSNICRDFLGFWSPRVSCTTDNSSCHYLSNLL